MYITIHGGNDDGAFRYPLHLLEIVFQVGHGLLHDFGRLQDERQDQLARAELIADFLHRREKDVIQ